MSAWTNLRRSAAVISLETEWGGGSPLDVMADKRSRFVRARPSRVVSILQDVRAYNTCGFRLTIGAQKNPWMPSTTCGSLQLRSYWPDLYLRKVTLYVQEIAGMYVGGFSTFTSHLHSHRNI